MKRIEKVVKQYRLRAVQDWIASQTKDFTDEEKAKVYPHWIKILESKGEKEIAMHLEQDLQKILSRIPKKLNIFERFLNWVREKIKR